MPRKQKVLIIENSRYVTGGFKAIFSLTEALKDKCDFHYIIPKGSKVRSVLEAHQYPVEELAMLEISRRVKTLLYLPVLNPNANRVIKYMDEHNISILHVNDIFNQLGCAVKFKRPAFKLVYHVRLLKSSYISAFYPLFAKMIARYADKIICVSEAVYRDINKNSKAVVLYDRPHTTEKQNPWNGLLHPGQARILYLSNYIPGKGQQLALQVLKKLVTTYPAISLHFYGDVQEGLSQKYLRQLKKYVAVNNLHRNVFFNGRAEDIETTMKAHDLVLNMSESESFSFVCLEAVLYGVPLVTTNSGGPAEITDYGKMALLTPNKNIPETAAAIKNMLTNPEQYTRLSKAAKNWAEKHFDFNTTVNFIHKIYTENQ